MSSLPKLFLSSLLILCLSACASSSSDAPPTSGPTTNAKLVVPSSGTFQE